MLECGKSCFTTNFDAEFDEFPVPVQDAIYAGIEVLKEFGPRLGRRWVDTLKGSTFSNMKELRCSADDGEWRIAFAFDPKRQAILLVGGDKSGIAQQRFYRTLLVKADLRFAAHLKAPSAKEK